MQLQKKSRLLSVQLAQQNGYLGNGWDFKILADVMTENRKISGREVELRSLEVECNDGKVYNFTLNQESINNLVSNFGSETQAWKDKKFHLKLETREFKETKKEQLVAVPFMLVEQINVKAGVSEWVEMPPVTKS